MLLLMFIYMFPSQPLAAGWCATMTVWLSPEKGMGGSRLQTLIQTSVPTWSMLPQTLRNMSLFLFVRLTHSAIGPSMSSKPGQCKGC